MGSFGKRARVKRAIERVGVQTLNEGAASLYRGVLRGCDHGAQRDFCLAASLLAFSQDARASSRINGIARTRAGRAGRQTGDAVAPSPL